MSETRLTSRGPHARMKGSLRVAYLRKMGNDRWTGLRADGDGKQPSRWYTELGTRLQRPETRQGTRWEDKAGMADKYSSSNEALAGESRRRRRRRRRFGSTAAGKMVGNKNQTKETQRLSGLVRRLEQDCRGGMGMLVLRRGWQQEKGGREMHCAAQWSVVASGHWCRAVVCAVLPRCAEKQRRACTPSPATAATGAATGVGVRCVYCCCIEDCCVPWQNIYNIRVTIGRTAWSDTTVAKHAHNHTPASHTTLTDTPSQISVTAPDTCSRSR